MFKGQIINTLLTNKKASKKDLIDFVGLSKSQVYKIINGEAMPQADNLERIADFFNVSMDIFFDRKIDAESASIQIGHTVTGLVNNITGDISLSECQKELEHLRTLLQEKEKQLEEKERLIQILMTK